MIGGWIEDFKPNDYELLCKIREDFNNEMIPLEEIKLDTVYRLTYIVDSGLFAGCRKHMESYLGYKLEDLSVLHLNCQVISIEARSNSIYLICTTNEGKAFGLGMDLRNIGKSWRLKKNV